MELLEGPDAVIDFCIDSLGQKEVHGNKAFVDSVFHEKMKQVGWQVSQAWCAYFAELAWTSPTYIGKSDLYQLMVDCFSANAVHNLTTFAKHKEFVIDKEPRKGAVIIFANYRNGEAVRSGNWTMGHAGIVEKVEGDVIHTIEGNTNEIGSREGDCVARKRRPLDFTRKERGLVLIGFIYPKQWIQ